MSEYEGVLEAAKSIAELGSKVVPLVKGAREEKDEALGPQLLRLRADTLAAAQRFATECREVRSRFEAAGVDLGQTLDQAYAGTGFLEVRRWLTVNRCRARMAGFVAEFRSLLDDATSILRCARRSEQIQQAYAESREAVRWLERRPLGGTPMGEFLDSLTDQADRLVSELGHP